MSRRIGYFERRARERRLREALWRAFWVEQHAYDPEWVDDVPEFCRDEAFAWAVDEERRLMHEAERLGFEGDPVWALERMSVTRSAS